MIQNHLTEPKEGVAIENVVIYHDPCPDGWMCAVLARKFLGAGTTLYEGRNYDKPFEQSMMPIYEGKNVYILDFSMPVEDLKMIASKAKKVVVCDHHKSFAEKLGVTQNLDLHPNYQLEEGNLAIHFFSLLCGAQITWECFTDGLRGFQGSEEPMPALVEYIADRDLWQWKLPKSRAISAALHVEPRDFTRWLNLIDLFNDPDFCTQYADRGAAILTAQQAEVERMAERAFLERKSLFSPIPVEENDPNWQDLIPIVNVQSYYSEVCECLLKLYPSAPFVASYYDKNLTTRIWSLRSRKDSNVDVSAIAKAFPGGGGHKNAAGFTQPVTRGSI
jgi:oligoribonuclease NrnB/cAMP/cGMP phosphodiesterase (DHH superfamily)